MRGWGHDSGHRQTLKSRGSAEEREKVRAATHWNDHVYVRYTI